MSQKSEFAFIWLVWVQGFLQPKLAWNVPRSSWEWPWTKIFLSQPFKCWGLQEYSLCHLKQIIYGRESQQRTSTLVSPNRSYEMEHHEEGWDPDVLPSQSLYQWNFETRCSYWEHLRNEPSTGYSAKSFSRQRWLWREGQRHTKRRDFM